MDTRVINLASVSGNLSVDRLYLSCTSDESSDTMSTLTILVGGGTYQPDSIVKKNTEYRNYKETGIRVGLFGTSPVFFALRRNSKRSMHTNEYASLRTNRDAALRLDDGTVSCPNQDVSYRRGRRRAA